MLTPLDIENKVFSKSMRGYNADEVDLFLDQIILDMQTLISENANLKNSSAELSEEIERLKQSERSVLNTIESAKRLMTDISESAEKRANVIIRNAQLDAAVIEKDAKESVTRLTEEANVLRQKIKKFKERYTAMLEDELKNLDDYSDSFFAQLDRDFTPAPPVEEVMTEDKEEEVDEPKVTRDTVVIKSKPVEEKAIDKTEGRFTSKETTVINRDELEKADRAKAVII